MFSRRHSGSRFHNAAPPLIANCLLYIWVAHVRRRRQTMEVVNWGCSSCAQSVGQEGDTYRWREMNCWGAFPKCFLSGSYLSEYPFQLLLTFQWASLFFLQPICTRVCVEVVGEKLNLPSIQLDQLTSVFGLGWF